jgi:hypothetical protein
MALAGQRHLGLFVTGQLAKRHGISVSLQESAYGGIKAIVLVPSSATEPESSGSSSGELTQQVPAGPSRPGRRHASRPNYVPQPVQDPVPRLPSKAEETARLWPEKESEITIPPALSDFAPFEPVTPAVAEPMPAPTPRERQPSPPRRERAPLPRRKRQANLVPQLQLDAQTTPKTRQPRRTRTPEEAHNSMSSFQRGSREGRGPSSEHNR